MKPDGAIKLVSCVLDLPILDADGRYCGIADDIEFTGGPGKAAKIAVILVGPGAYAGRMPSWLFAIVGMLAGKHIARVPWSEVETVTAAVHLKCTAAAVGLHKTENRVRRLIPRYGAM